MREAEEGVALATRDLRHRALDRLVSLISNFEKNEDPTADYPEDALFGPVHAVPEIESAGVLRDLRDGRLSRDDVVRLAARHEQLMAWLADPMTVTAGGSENDHDEAEACQRGIRIALYFAAVHIPALLSLGRPTHAVEAATKLFHRFRSDAYLTVDGLGNGKERRLMMAIGHQFLMAPVLWSLTAFWPDDPAPQTCPGDIATARDVRAH